MNDLSKEEHEALMDSEESVAAIIGMFVVGVVVPMLFYWIRTNW